MEENLLNIWIDSFEHKDIANVKHYVTSSQMIKNFEEFPLLRVHISRKEYEKLPNIEKKEEYLVKKLGIGNNVDINPYFKFFTSVFVLPNNKIGPLFDEMSYIIYRFLIVYTQQIKQILDSINGMKRAEEEDFDRLRKLIYNLIITEKVAFKLSKNYIGVAMRLISYLYYVISAMFGSLTFCTKQEEINKNMINGEIMLLQLITTNKSIFSSPCISNTIGYVIEICVACAATPGNKAEKSLLYKAILCSASDERVNKKLTKDQFKKIKALIFIIANNESSIPKIEKIGYFSLLLDFLALIKMDYENYKIVIETVLNYLDSTFVEEFGEITEPDSPKVDIPNIEKSIVYHKDINYGTSLFKDVETNEYEMVIKGKKTFNNMFFNIVISFDGCIQKNENLALILLNSFTDKINLATVAFFMNMLSNKDGKYEKIIEKSNFISFVFNEKYMDGRILQRSGESYDLFKFNLIKFINRFLDDPTIGKIFMNQIIQTLNRNDYYVNKFFASYLMENYVSRKLIMTDLKLFDALIEADSALKFYLVNNKDSEIYSDIAEARGQLLDFIVIILTSHDLENNIYLSEQHILYIFSLLYEDSLSPLIFSILREKISNIGSVKCLINLIISFLKKKKSDINTKMNTTFYKEMLNVITTAVENDSSDMDIVIQQKKVYTFIADIPKYYVEKEDIDTQALKELFVLVLNIFYKASITFRDFNAILNNPPYEVFQKLSIVKKYIQLDDEINDILVRYITLYNDDEFNQQIYNCGPLYFLIDWAHDTPLYDQILEKLSTLCMESFCNRYQVFRTGILPTLIKDIDQSVEKRSPIFNLLLIVGSTYFHKKELLTTLKVVASGSPNGINILHLISAMIAGHQDYQPSYIHLFSISSSIFTTKITDINNEFTLEMFVGFYSKKPYYRVLHVISPNIDFNFQLSVSNNIIFVELVIGGKIKKFKQIEDNSLKAHWSKIKLIMKPNTAIIELNEKSYALMKNELVKVEIPSEVIIDVTECEFSHLTVTTVTKKSNINPGTVVLGNFNSKNSEGEVVVNNGEGGHDGIIKNAVIVNYTPTVLNTIVSVGGPIVLLPLFEVVKKYKNDDKYIEALFSLLSPILSGQENMFSSQHLFSHLNIIIKNTDVNYLRSLYNYICSSYNTIIDPELKKEMCNDFLFDFSIMKRIPRMIGQFFLTNISVINKFPSYLYMLRVILNAFKDDDYNQEMEDNVLQIIMLRNSMDVESVGENADNILVLAYNFKNKFVSRLMHKAIDTVFTEFFDNFVEFFCKHGLEPFLCKLSQSKDLIIIASEIFIITTVFPMVYSETLNKNTYRILSVLDFNPDEPVEVIKEIIKCVQEKNDYSKTNSAMYHSQMFPMICNLITKMDKETADKMLTDLYISVVSYPMEVFNPYFIFCVLYIMNFTKDFDNWVNTLFPERITSHFINYLSVYICIAIKLFGWDKVQVKKVVTKTCLRKISDPKVFRTFLIMQLYSPSFDKKEEKEIENYQDYIFALDDYLEEIPTIQLVETPKDESFFEIGKEIMKKLINENFSLVNSNNSWKLVLDIILPFESQDKAIFTEYIDAVIEFIKKNTKYDFLIFNSYIKVKENLISNEPMIDIIDDNLTYVKKIEETLSGIKKDLNIFMNDYKSPTEVLEDIKGKIIPKYENFEKEWEIEVGNLEEFEREDKRRSKLWRDTKNDLEYSLDSIWSNSEGFIHKKIDFVTDLYGRHYRMKPNKSFNTHKDASMRRDNGCDEGIVKIPSQEQFFDDEKHSLNSKIIRIYNVQMLNITKEFIGKLYVSQKCLSFDAEFVNRTFSTEQEKSTKYIEIKTDSIKRILWKRFKLVDRALEIYTKINKDYYFIFANTEERNSFIKLITSEKVKVNDDTLIQSKPINETSFVTDLTKMWQENKLTNYQYLYWLNIFAGRSFNDATQYPVFPWILSNYKLQKLDLSDENQFRDLSKPVGTFNEARLEDLIEKEESLADNPDLPDICLYRVHYSTQAYVIIWLLRCEPFTSLHINFQKNKFDSADRLFFSIEKSWDSVNSEQADFRELIPEFFTMSEFLMNKDKFDLGKLQSGQVVDDVILPPWAKNAAHFILMNRLALESPYVSKNISSWIDLIFGYKQRGEESKKAHNNFSVYSYYECLKNEKIEPVIAMESAFNLGITPDNLFSKPHPSKYANRTLPQSFQKQGLVFEVSPAFETYNFSNIIKLQCNETHFYAISNNGTIYQIHIVKDKVKHTVVTEEKYPFQTNSRNHVHILPLFNCIIACAPYRNTFDLISIDKKEILHTSPMQNSAIMAITGAEYNSIVSCGIDSSVTSWNDVISGKYNVISGHTECIVDIQSSARLDAVVSVDESGKMIVSSLLTGKPFAVEKLSSVPKQIFLTRLGYIVIIYAGVDLNEPGNIELRDLNLNVINSLKTKQEYTLGCVATLSDCVELLFCCFNSSPEGTRIRTIRLCDFETVSILSIKSRVTSICFSSDEMCLALETSDNVFQMYNYTLSK